MDQLEKDLYRARVAWHMRVIDVWIGHHAFGFNYPMSGDDRPGMREGREVTR